MYNETLSCKLRASVYSMLYSMVLIPEIEPTSFTHNERIIFLVIVLASHLTSRSNFTSSKESGIVELGNGFRFE